MGRFIRRHQASSGVIRRHQASSSVIRRHQASSGVIRTHLISMGRLISPRRSEDARDPYAEVDATGGEALALAPAQQAQRARRLTRRMGILDAAGGKVTRLLRHQERHQERARTVLALAHRLRGERAAGEGASAASRRHTEADQRRFSGHGAPAHEATGATRDLPS